MKAYIVRFVVNMRNRNISEFDFTKFLGCKMPEVGPKTLEEIVRNLLTMLKCISPLSGVITNRF